MSRRWHVWIARGPTAASAEFWALTEGRAKAEAAALWSVPADDLGAHLSLACKRHECA